VKLAKNAKGARGGGKQRGKVNGGTGCPDAARKGEEGGRDLLQMRSPGGQNDPLVDNVRLSAVEMTWTERGRGPCVRGA